MVGEEALLAPFKTYLAGGPLTLSLYKFYLTGKYTMKVLSLDGICVFVILCRS